MKHVISVSLGSSLRDKKLELVVLGEKVLVERIGTNGNLKKAAEIIKAYEGKADAIGFGGADLGMLVGGRYYPIHSLKRFGKLIQKTPLLDGIGLKNTLESSIAGFLEKELGEWLDQQGRKVLLVSSVSRWGMAQSFINAGYHCTFGDFVFTLGLPLPLHSRKNILLSTRIFCPLITRLPFHWLYPIGEQNNKHKPMFDRYYQEATVIAGDCLYIMQSLPKNLDGKIIVTNTTTEADIEAFRKAGIKYLVTTTPVYEGRSFGTNVLEAIITAISNKNRQLSDNELYEWIDKLNIVPQLQKIN